MVLPDDENGGFPGLVRCGQWRERSGPSMHRVSRAIRNEHPRASAQGYRMRAGMPVPPRSGLAGRCQLAVGQGFADKSASDAVHLVDRIQRALVVAPGEFVDVPRQVLPAWH